MALSLPSSPTPPPSKWRLHPHTAREEVSPHIFDVLKRQEIVCKDVLTVEGTYFSGTYVAEGNKPSTSRRRPAVPWLVIPKSSATDIDFSDTGKKQDNEVEHRGRDFFLVSKKGMRKLREDRHAVMLDIAGDPKQAFCAVIDGHGGCAAGDYVEENLGKNIVSELERVGNEENQIEAALRAGYSATDTQFLAKDETGGACAVSVLMKDGEMHVAHVGDCRAVLSRKGKATTLTNDHRVTTREDERSRIENNDGLLLHRGEAWRVSGSLAVSRAFGDIDLKKWVISEPEIVKLPLTSDCEFLIMASDGLWDKVSEQEAVDVIVGESNSMEACKKLVDISSRRGNKDDITVMIINLHNFKINVD